MVGSGADQGQGFKRTAQRLAGGQAEPLVQEGGVDATEVHGHLEVAVLEVGQAGIGARETRLYLPASQEDRGRRAVI